ncbi:MAG: histidine kinase [Actinomycetota bacterium]
MHEQSAPGLAEGVLQLLHADAVAITDDRQLLGTAGVELEWERTIHEHTQHVLEQRRSARPTFYEMTLGRTTRSVAVAVITNDELPVGTLHVVMPADAPLDLSELQELSALISSQLQLAELEQSRVFAAEAELRALRAQVSPHFLHNALTAIAGLVNTNPERARELIAVLAEFLRVTFRPQTPMTTFAEELRLVEAYLELERARFGDRFEIQLNIAPETLVVEIPFLTIQPLVENAVRHGLEARSGPGKLSIIAEDAGPEIAIHVEDNGVGIDPDALSTAMEGTDSSFHVGILSVDTRLRARFGAEYGLTIETGADAGTKATVRLPK